MTDQEKIREDVKALAVIVGKLNERVDSIFEALQLVRQISDLQDQRLANLEDFMQKVQNPNL
jgi:ABC-type transporter Mla subunit MlaD